MNELNYPIKFKPILKENLWGGTRLKSILNKDITSDITGESWEISAVEESVSVVSNGILKGKRITDLIAIYKSNFLGAKVFKQFGTKFPLLIKFIDAKQHLSVQLHPNDELAKERHNSFGKTEMWYVMDAEPTSELNIGFNKELSKNTYLEYLNSGKLTEILNFEKVNTGDAFFIAAGRVHAIGAGALIAEIQQTSDITYRIYDWDRKDKDGNDRELHTELALDAIDFSCIDDFSCNYDKNSLDKNQLLVNCSYFTTIITNFTKETILSFPDQDSFKILMCVEGEGDICIDTNVETIKKGETIFVPAIVDSLVVKTNSNLKLLQVSV